MSGLRPHVHNAQRKLRVDLNALQKFAERALQLCLAESSPATSALQTAPELTIVLVSDRRMTALHKKFMNIPRPTDVITFQHGEIYVSVETAERNAEALQTSVDEEVRLYLIHGMLHLHGFDDTTSEKARTMEWVQGRILSAASAASG